MPSLNTQYTNSVGDKSDLTLHSVFILCYMEDVVVCRSSTSVLYKVKLIL